MKKPPCRTRKTTLRPHFVTRRAHAGGTSALCRASYPDAGYQFQYRSGPNRRWTYVYCGAPAYGRRRTEAHVRSQLLAMCNPGFGQKPKSGEYRYILCTWRRFRKGWRPIIKHATYPVELTFE